MGIYINPTDCTKEEWLHKHGTLVPAPAVALKGSEQAFKDLRSTGLMGVCLVDNGAFSAAGVCYSAGEMQAFAAPDERTKRWFVCLVTDLQKVCPDLEKVL